MASGVGYLIGFVLGNILRCRQKSSAITTIFPLLGGILLSKFSRFFMIFIMMILLGITLCFVPWTSSLWAVDTVYTVIGIALAFLMTGTKINVIDETFFKLLISCRRQCALFGLLGQTERSVHSSTSLLSQSRAFDGTFSRPDPVG